MGTLQKYPLRHHGCGYCSVPDYMVSGVAVGSSCNNKLCLLHDSSAWSKEKADAWNDDDTKNNMLYLDDCTVFIKNEERQTKLVSVEDAWLTDNRLDVGDIWPEE